MLRLPKISGSCIFVVEILLVHHKYWSRIITSVNCIGGYMANSLAIMTDASHMLSDFASFLISLFALWVARRPATQKMSFGYYRAEVMGALCSVLIIWVLTGRYMISLVLL